MSSPAAPDKVSAPKPPTKILALASPVNVSSVSVPTRFSNPLIFLLLSANKVARYFFSYSGTDYSDTQYGQSDTFLASVRSISQQK